MPFWRRTKLLILLSNTSGATRRMDRRLFAGRLLWDEPFFCGAWAWRAISMCFAQHGIQKKPPGVPASAMTATANQRCLAANGGAERLAGWWQCSGAVAPRPDTMAGRASRRLPALVSCYYYAASSRGRAGREGRRLLHVSCGVAFLCSISLSPARTGLVSSLAAQNTGAGKYASDFCARHACRAHASALRRSAARAENRAFAALET